MLSHPRGCDKPILEGVDHIPAELQKYNKAAGVDHIPAELLKNNKAADVDHIPA